MFEHFTRVLKDGDIKGTPHADLIRINSGGALFCMHAVQTWAVRAANPFSTAQLETL
jgi:hypothetical protein